MLDYNPLASSSVKVLAIAVWILAACEAPPPVQPTASGDAEDVHSYANIDAIKVSQLDLDLEVQFDKKVLDGSVTLSFEKSTSADTIVLDTRDLTITKAEISPDDITYEPVEFELGTADKILGAPLEVKVPISSGKLRIHYTTSPGATAVQWLTPQQTAGKRHPFLFTQSQAIHARSWIPLQDSPAVKTTYSAKIRTPKALRAVMSAGNQPNELLDGEFDFAMPQPIPSYLIALAVGDLEFRAIGERTGVYSEPSVVDLAAKEFEDTERMLEAAESLFGTYRWGRYDLLVLPPSFPYGGMENPRLTFATPTILAGDKSLVSLVAHELAHSWAGNLVTNATWSDFWLNEGFTVYLERRIQEAVYGRDRAAMEATLGRQDLEQELARLDGRDQVLHVDLDGRDPDDGMTDVPYEKGCLFLTTLETAYGREALTAYLKGYFDRFAFQSITTAQFEEDLRFHLLNRAGVGEKVPVHEWIHESGIPAGAWQPSSDAFDRVEAAVRPWLDGSGLATSIPASDWSTQEWLHLLDTLPDGLGPQKMGELDSAFHLTQTGNSEILCQWLILAIKNDYQPGYARAAEFLTAQGRRKFLKPLYTELAKTTAGMKRAQAIYKKARPTYHPISVTTIDEILSGEAD